jgi:D-amino-acid oxidase
MAPPNPTPPDPNFIILGAGVIGLTTALVLRHHFPTATITIVAKHFPGDRSIEYTSPWAGANWCSIANDDGVLEGYDRVTFDRFTELVGKVETGVGWMALRGVFDA